MATKQNTLTSLWGQVLRQSTSADNQTPTPSKSTSEIVTAKATAKKKCLQSLKFIQEPKLLPNSFQTHNLQARSFSTDDSEESRITREYEDAANETLISLSDMFEDIAETLDVDPDYDVSFENGVLTVAIDRSWGTYVINKQTPNRQIWLSSPLSGPKRYDLKDNKWIYSHDGQSLHELLTKEISEAFQQELNFTDCAYGS